MKRKILILGLIFSLTINIAVLTTIGHHWLGREKEERHHREGKNSSMSYLYKELALSESQIKEMESLRESLEPNMDGTKEELREKRVELVALLTESKPDRKKINEKLIEIESLQGILQKFIIDNIIQQKEILAPEQQKKLLSIISRRICPVGMHQGENLLLMMDGIEGECKHE